MAIRTAVCPGKVALQSCCSIAAFTAVLSQNRCTQTLSRKKDTASSNSWEGGINHFKLISIHFCDVMMKVSVFYPYFWRHPEYTSCTSHSLKFKAVISLSWLKRSELHATSARTLRPRHVVRSLCGPAGHGGHSPGQAIVIVINRKAMYNSFSRLSGSFLHHAKHIKHANQARMPRGLSQCRALGQLQGEFQGMF